jgi:AcrR family transcriptional regulator
MAAQVMTKDRRQVELLEKNKPRQARAKRTYESILAAAGELLVDVGVERISTNLIAERAGITVPALYRYFPNKYSVLHALGAVLMDRQNLTYQKWVDSHLQADGVEGLVENIQEVLKLVYDVTLAQTGGLEVSHALRAIAPLQQLRMTSHRIIAEWVQTLLSELLDRPSDEVVEMQSRLIIEIAVSIVELALENNAISAEHTLEEGANMLRAYVRQILATG